MSGQKLVRLALVVIGAVALSLGSALTAANVVPPSNAGVSSLPFLTACSFPISVTFSPKSINSRNVHDTITATIRYPDGLPPGYTGSLAGGLISGVGHLIYGEKRISPTSVR